MAADPTTQRIGHDIAEAAPSALRAAGRALAVTPMNWQFFLEVLMGGLLAGVMYSLVALGFVLIYKASGVFNFAQGAMVFFAALTFVSLVERGVNFWLALAITLAVMVVLGIAIERLVLRPLVNQPQITLFMATIGLTFVLEGLSQLLWGSQPHGLELGIPDEPMQWLSDLAGINVSQFDVFAAVVAGCWSRCSRCSSRRRASAVRCARSPTTTRQHSRSASRCGRSGQSCGPWRASSRWWRASCGARATAFSTR